MRYGIANLVIGKNPFVRLTEKEFNEIKLAHRSLTEILYIEEKFNLVMENYAEYEKELLVLTTDAMIFTDISYSGFQAQKHTVNRRLVNLLTTCRLYRDQILHNLNVIYGEKSDLMKETEKQMSSEYDTHLEYRVMEALRNFVQHRDLPISQFSRYSEWVGEEPDDVLQFSVIPNIEVSKLREGETFKKPVLKELEALGEKFDIRPMVRVYMDSICRIQKFIRERVKGDVDKWKGLILATEKRYRKRQKEAHGIAVVAQTKDYRTVEKYYITQNIINRYEELVIMNSGMKRFIKFVVTSDCRPKK